MQTQLISDSLQQLAGKPAWGLTRSHGSMFLLEIGKAMYHGNNSRGEASIHGEWCFIFECSWSFHIDDGACLDSNASPNLIDSEFGRFSLGNVASAEFEAEINTLQIRFTSGQRLVVLPADDSLAEFGDTEWTFFIPGELAWVKAKTALTLGDIHAPRAS